MKPHSLPLEVGVVLLLAALLAASAMVVAPPLPKPSDSLDLFLPPDGHLETADVGFGPVQVEAAWLNGSELVSSGPEWLSLARDNFSTVLAGNWLRLTTWYPNEESTYQGYDLFEHTDAGLQQSIAGADEEVFFFHPARLMLPKQLIPGSTWSSQGQMHSMSGINLNYRSAGRAAEAALPKYAEIGCLDITRDDTIGPDSFSMTETWCPGRGRVSGDQQSLPQLANSDSLEAPRPVQGWEISEVKLGLAPPMAWGTKLPVTGSSKVLAIGQQPSEDVIFVPNGSSQLAWRAHPGGALTNLAEVNGVILASTTDFRMVAYGLYGGRYWDFPLPELVTIPPTLLKNQLLVFDAAGQLTALKFETGVKQWQLELPGRPSAELATCEDRVYAATSDGTLTALDSRGEILWESELSEPATQVLCVANGVVVVSEPHLRWLDGEGNYVASELTRDAIVEGMWLLDGIVVTSSDSNLTSYRLTSDGLQQAWRIKPKCLSTVANRGLIFCRLEDSITAYFPDGSVSQSWPLPFEDIEKNSEISVLSDGLILLDSRLTGLVLS